MTIVAGDILRTAVNFALNDGQQCQNVFYHERTGVAIISDQDHLDALELWAETMYAELVVDVNANVIPQLCQVDLIEWDVDQWLIAENIGIFTPTIVFTSNEHALPNQSSAFVIFKTARPKSVGKKFLPPYVETRQAGTFLEAGAVTTTVAWADDAVNDISLAALNDLVPGIVRTGANVWLEYTAAVVTNVLGSQRRRRPGTGS